MNSFLGHIAGKGQTSTQPYKLTSCIFQSNKYFAIKVTCGPCCSLSVTIFLWLKRLQPESLLPSSRLDVQGYNCRHKGTVTGSNKQQSVEPSNGTAKVLMTPQGRAKKNEPVYGELVLAASQLLLGSCEDS